MKRAQPLLLAWVIALLPAAASSARAEDAVLHVMVFDPTGMTEAWNTASQLAREFERENPGVRVVLLSEGADPITKLKIMLAARQPIDIAMIDVVEFSSFLADGVLLDLQPYFDADPDWRPQDYFKKTVDAFRDRRGHLYGLPSTFTPYVMYYNKDIFDEEGIPYPRPGWTWDEFRDIARRCSHPPDQYGVSITQWLQALAPWVWQNGGSFLGADGTRAATDSPETIGAFRFLYELFQKDKVASTDASYEGQLTRGLFQDGKVALYGPVGYWEVYRFKEIHKFQWDVCPLPRGKQAATSIAMRSYVGFSHTRHPELTYRFIRKLAGSRMCHTLARIGNGVPGLVDVAYSNDFLKPNVPPESEHVFIDVMHDARFLPVFANWREIESIVKEEVQGCLITGRYDPETACHRMTEKIDAFLARSRVEEQRPRISLWWLAAATVLLCGGGLLVSWMRRGARPSPIRWREERAGYRFIALWGVGFLIFTLGPMLASLGLSFTNWSPIRALDEAHLAGLANYAHMVADDSFLASLRVTAVYALFSVPLTLALALGLALLVRRGHSAYRAIFYLPVIVSAVAVGLIWRWLFDSTLVTSLLGIPWSQSESWVLPGFVVMSLWTVGGPMLVFLAGLQGIEPSLYEAARLDGAPRWRQFLHVTVPQLTPVLLFNLIIGIITAFQTFAQPYVMTDGGPGNASLFYVLYLFKMAFRYHHMGYASALGWVLFLLLLALTVVLLRSSRTWVHYEGEAS